MDKSLSPYVIKDRDEYLTLQEAAEMLGMSPYAMEVFRTTIGFRKDPRYSRTPIFHQDDLEYFMATPDYKVFRTLEIFIDPLYKAVINSSSEHDDLVSAMSILYEWLVTTYQKRSIEINMPDVNGGLDELSSK
jgi:hypothetical protein